MSRHSNCGDWYLYGPRSPRRKLARFNDRAKRCWGQGSQLDPAVVEPHLQRGIDMRVFLGGLAGATRRHRAEFAGIISNLLQK